MWPSWLSSMIPSGCSCTCRRMTCICRAHHGNWAPLRSRQHALRAAPVHAAGQPTHPSPAPPLERFSLQRLTVTNQSFKSSPSGLPLSGAPAGSQPGCCTLRCGPSDRLAQGTTQHRGPGRRHSAPKPGSILLQAGHHCCCCQLPCIEPAEAPASKSRWLDCLRGAGRCGRVAGVWYPDLQELQSLRTPHDIAADAELSGGGCVPHSSRMLHSADADVKLARQRGKTIGQPPGCTGLGQRVRVEVWVCTVLHSGCSGCTVTPCM